MIFCKFYSYFHTLISITPCNFQIQVKINELTTALNDLELDWAKRNAWLENLYDSQAFMRDARYLDRLSTSQEVIYNYLQSLTYPCLIYKIFS